MQHPLNPRNTTAPHLVRAVTSTFLARADAVGNPDPVAIAAKQWPFDDRTSPIIKAAVDPAATSGHAGLVGASVVDFLADLPASAASKLMNEALALPLDTGDVSVPFGSADATMDWVGEGDPIPVVSGSTGALQLSVRKMGVITVASRELAKRSAAEQIFATMLRREAGRALDRAIFATDAGDATKVAGLLAGVSPIDGGPFGTVGEALSGLAGALADAGGSGEVFIAASPATAARIMIEHPQLAWTIAPSRALSAGQVVAIDPLGCVFGAGDTVDLESAVAALLHMSDVPSPIVDTAAADPTRSLWQTDGIATRLIVDLAFAARPGAVALVEGVS